ncbi:MAG: hypothetical protein QGH42_01830 [Kiritimatiellia bacterium]|jgi:uncharacterized membrane protein|nr:hypothetical protein [Kiritimatiellia bacterium]MDP6809237.1 hypothetical protein [Kiritimatiellia bacterium]MDP7022976.1 hypothetical protein [Kiritimatiellia bacterium]
METPNQIAHGLGAFLIAILVTGFVANVFVTNIPAHAERFATGGIGLGVFVIVWWISYAISIRAARRRSRSKSAE